ncbi:MAG: hypothetical protein NXH88_17240, partial [Hyphomonas sp.]|nr:hypothetical protein [Hyphomonas sp.]
GNPFAFPAKTVEEWEKSIGLAVSFGAWKLVHDETEAKRDDKATSEMRWHRKKLFIVIFPTNDQLGIISNGGGGASNHLG